MAHLWEDAEEPETCETDRHVTELVKHEVKQPMQSSGQSPYGADLNDVMHQTGRSRKSIIAGAPSLKKGLSQGLVRQVTKRLTMSKTIEQFQDDYLAVPSGELTGKRHREVKRMKSNLSNNEVESVISQKGILSGRKTSSKNAVGVR